MMLCNCLKNKCFLLLRFLLNFCLCENFSFFVSLYNPAGNYGNDTKVRSCISAACCTWLEQKSQKSLFSGDKIVAIDSCPSAAGECNARHTKLNTSHALNIWTTARLGAS